MQHLKHRADRLRRNALARGQGFVAATEGKPSTTNPYNPATEAGAAWLAGFAVGLHANPLHRRAA